MTTIYRLYLNDRGERNWAVITPEDTFGPVVADEKSTTLALGYYDEAGKYLGLERPIDYTAAPAQEHSLMDTLPDVIYGPADATPSDWRSQQQSDPLNDDDDDDELAATPQSVVEMLGFDPLDADEDEAEDNGSA